MMSVVRAAVRCGRNDWWAAKVLMDRREPSRKSSVGLWPDVRPDLRELGKQPAA